MKGESENLAKGQHSENYNQGLWSPHFFQIDGETMETVTEFIFLGSKITADDDCSHETKRPLFLGRKAIANIDSILKRERERERERERDYFADKGLSSQSYGFSSSHVWM